MSERAYKKWIIAISVAVPVIVTALVFVKIPVEGINLRFFPQFHAILNSLTTVLLVAGFFFIKRKNIRLHKMCMLGAIGCSVVFLLSYVFYHAISEPTRFGGEGLIRPVYFFILISHIVLAAAILPFVLITVSRALMGQYARHKKIARWTFPVWLYVAVTGVAVYLLMGPYY
ncbi:MAG: hypothetical protein KatS3mg031_1085 [Chitinophagales bacterium]|nr:MAG: hypothetical protein KatS3mg031_1085 [Chitinophagales bacterium]